MSQTTPPTPPLDLNKMWGGAAGSGIGGAIATIVVWLIGVIWPVQVPPEIAVAFSVVFTTLTSMIGVYLTRSARLVGQPAVPK